MSLQVFLGNLKSVSVDAQSRDASDQLADLLSIDLSKPDVSSRIAALQIELQGNKSLNLETLVEEQNYFDGDWIPFNSIVVSYLKLCRDIDPLSILKSHDLLLVFYNDLSIAFLNNTFGNHLSIALFESTKIIVPMMKRIDFFLNLQNNGKKFKRLIFVSTLLTKIFNHLRALKGQSNKRLLIIFIVNNLNKIYFIINSPLLCANIFANMNLLNLRFHQYPKSQQIEYRYILGRYYMIKNQFFKAYHHLQWSYLHSSKFNDTKNTLRILRFLIPISLLIGKTPSKQILNISPEFQQYYIPLVKHLINGNFLGVQKHLFDYQEYFKSKFLLVLLVQRTRILIFRNLVFNVFRLTQSPQNQTARLSYDEIGVALQKSIGTSQQQQQLFGNQYMYQILNVQIENSFIENICVSLNENELIKGNVLSKSRTLVLSRKEPFPDIFNSYKKRYGPSSNERWMN